MMAAPRLGNDHRGWDQGHLVSKSFIRTAKTTPGLVKPEDRERLIDGQAAWSEAGSGLGADDAGADPEDLLPQGTTRQVERDLERGSPSHAGELLV